MADFPVSPRIYNPIAIGTFTFESALVPIAAQGASSTASTAWPSANLAIFIPVEIRMPVTIAKMMVNNGTVVSGNIDVGIYDASWNKLVSAGSTAQAGTSAIQIFDITDTLLKPGLHYMGVALSNNTGTLAGWSLGNAVEGRPFGLAQMASAFALPNPVTPATYAQTFVPMVSMTPRTAI